MAQWKRFETVGDVQKLLAQFGKGFLARLLFSFEKGKKSIGLVDEGRLVGDNLGVILLPIALNEHFRGEPFDPDFAVGKGDLRNVVIIRKVVFNWVEV